MMLLVLASCCSSSSSSFALGLRSPAMQHGGEAPAEDCRAGCPCAPPARPDRGPRVPPGHKRRGRITVSDAVIDLGLSIRRPRSCSTAWWTACGCAWRWPQRAGGLRVPGNPLPFPEILMHEWALAEAVVATVEKIRGRTAAVPCWPCACASASCRTSMEAFREAWPRPGPAVRPGSLPVPERAGRLPLPGLRAPLAAGRGAGHRGGGAGSHPLPAGKRARLPALPRLRQPGFRAGGGPRGLHRGGGAGG